MTEERSGCDRPFRAKQILHRPLMRGDRVVMLKVFLYLTERLPRVVTAAVSVEYQDYIIIYN